MFSSSERVLNGLSVPASVTVPRVARIFVTRLAINIGFPIPDQSHCKIIQLLEIVRRIKFVFSPVKPEPVDIPFHRADVLHVLGFGISIVKAKVTPTFVFRRKGEIETNRLGVSNMRVAVRLRWEARDDVATYATFLQIIIDDLLNKVPYFLGKSCFRWNRWSSRPCRMIIAKDRWVGNRHIRGPIARFGGTLRAYASETKKIPYRVLTPRLSLHENSMTIHARTERLILRDWSIDDVDSYA